jgi:hypothetical protein
MTRRRPQVGFTVAQGSAELTALTAGIVVVAGLGLVCSLVPAVERVINAVFALAAVLAVAARWGCRWLRERAEDRADEFAGAQWRTRNLPAPATARAGPERLPTPAPVSGHSGKPDPNRRTR